jgi:hypothetical protein
MTRLFFIGAIALGLFEILKVYFIMPMPGSQHFDTLDIAYFLHTYRWYFRVVFVTMTLVGSLQAFQSEKKWLPLSALLLLSIIIYVFNFVMTADHMFLQPGHLVFKPRPENTLSDSTVVLAVALKGEAKAYPLRFIIYHHQVRDTLAGQPIMVTYCSVCRTGRVFDPLVNGKNEQFRLVGMDHFNAMFEDASTKSWWRQATGEAITGPLKGTQLAEIESVQLTVNKFFSLYPFGQIMQAEEASKNQYDSLGNFEWGKSKSKLTGTDSLSWGEKSWVIGIRVGTAAKAYDWNSLIAKRIIHDQLNGVPLAIVLSADDQSFVVFERHSDQQIQLRNDTLYTNNQAYDFSGRNVDDPLDRLKRIQASQEFWHSWRTFYPQTEKHLKEPNE